MKQYFFLSLTLLFTLPLAGQVELPKPKEVDKEYRPDYRRAVREYNRVEKRLENEGWDFYLDPIESVPTDIISAEEARLLAYTNWYRDLVSPAALAEDMLKGASRKGVVLITDTACDSAHPDLQKGKIPGSTYAGTPCGNDVHGHGTHTWGITALICKPLVDAGWIEIKPVQFLGDLGQGSLAAITAGVDAETAWVEKNYLSVGKFAMANASWGGTTTVYGPLKTALDKSKSAGVAWFFAAGNTGGPVVFPGLLESVSAVSSLDNSLVISSFSCRGPEVDFAAGGRGIYSTHLNGGYASLSGTSMAAPALAGAGAVAMCVWPSLTAETLPGYLAKVAKDLGEAGKDSLYGNGAVFVRAILDTPPDGEPGPPTCTDGKRNGKETGVDCGGPDCPACSTCTDGIKNGKETGVDCGGPDCPPCKPSKPPYRKRTLPVEMEGYWVLGWWKTESSALKSGVGIMGMEVPGGVVYDYNLDAIPGMIKTAGRTDFKISKVIFEVESETQYEYEALALEANMKTFFRNRSLGTPATWDVYDAGRYILFFLDYYCGTGSSGYVPQVLKPVGVIFEWEGVEVVIRKEDMMDWKK